MELSRSSLGRGNPMFVWCEAYILCLETLKQPRDVLWKTQERDGSIII